MRHRVAGRKLSRKSAHRQAMLRNLVTELLEHEKIITTEAKAKEIRSLTERMITLGKKGTLQARRQALATIYDKKVVERLFKEIAPRYAEQSGGYTRILKLGFRPSDGAPIAQIELVKGTPSKS